MLDFPAGVLPAGRVTPDDDRALEDEREWSTGCERNANVGCVDLRNEINLIFLEGVKIYFKRV